MARGTNSENANSANQLLFGTRKSKNTQPPNSSRIQKFILDPKLTPNQAVFAAHMDPWILKLCQDKYTTEIWAKVYLQDQTTHVSFDMMDKEPRISLQTRLRSGLSVPTEYVDGLDNNSNDFNEFFTHEDRNLELAAALLMELYQRVLESPRNKQEIGLELIDLEDIHHKISKGYNLPQDELIYAVDRFSKYW